MQGIYRIKNVISDKVYIGQVSLNKGFIKRKQEHISLLRRNKHYNKHLQNSWNKHSEDKFIFEIVEEVNDYHQLDIREQHWIDQYWDISYNIQPTSGGSSLGKKHSKETRRKISHANSKRIWTQESKDKLSQSQKLRFSINPISLKTKQKMSRSQTGREHTKETKKKIRNAITGLKRSSSTKEKIKQAKLGHRNSPESVAKQVAKCRLNPSEGLSSFKGVRQHCGAWQARIFINLKTIYLGRFKSEEEAAKNVDYYAIKFFGKQNTYLNFPNFDYSLFNPKKKIKSP